MLELTPQLSHHLHSHWVCCRPGGISVLSPSANVFTTLSLTRGSVSQDWVHDLSQNQASGCLTSCTAPRRLRGMDFMRGSVQIPLHRSWHIAHFQEMKTGGSLYDNGEQFTQKKKKLGKRNARQIWENVSYWKWTYYNSLHCLFKFSVRLKKTSFGPTKSCSTIVRINVNVWQICINEKQTNSNQI